MRDPHATRRPRQLFYVAAIITVILIIYAYNSFLDAYIPLDSPSATPTNRFPEELFQPGASQTNDELWAERANAVKEAFRFAYRGYEEFAMPHDELLPLSDGQIDNFNGWGVTAVDSLDTMWLMGLTEEFDRAMDLVEKLTFSIPEGKYVPYFETVIRYLGGLLSAYALSERTILLERAEELAQELDPIFNTASGLPFFAVNPDTGGTYGPEIGNLAEIATLQLEYTYLGKATGKPQYSARADNVIKALASANLSVSGGMLPTKWNLTSGSPSDGHTSAGARADSAHEYLLKQYLLTDRTDKVNVEMYLRTTTYIMTHLMFITNNRELVYATDRPSPETIFPKFQLMPGQPTHVLEHLTCFLPGLFALGAMTLPLDNLSLLDIDFASLHTQGNISSQAYQAIHGFSSHSLRELHLWAADSLAETCWLMYADQPTGLSPDEIVFSNAWSYGHGRRWIDVMNEWRNASNGGMMSRHEHGHGRGGMGKERERLPPGVGSKRPVVYEEEERIKGTATGRDYSVKKSEYLLRPETVESLFLMWKVTGESKWRERGWWIFQNLEKESKTNSGFASLLSVEVSPAPKDDSMPSYFLAETLKYLYLICKNEDLVPLNKWVFNTEAHPLPIFSP
ncbi:hypothetical protein ONZ45_g9694 [Pleurotus djamor]|nr:hypothetical protein ONZ45_g9694 [Pleurotus djamor]